MENDSEQAAVADEAPARLPKLTLVVIALSVLLGIMLMVLAVGGYFYYQRGKALQAEVAAVRKDLQDKAKNHGEMQAQIEALSKQIGLLKENSVARSGASAENAAKDSAGEQVKEVNAEAQARNGKKDADISLKEGKPPGAGGQEAVAAKAPVQPAIPPKLKRPGTESQGCDITGKAPEEQAAILKRCVGVMDQPPKTVPGKK